MSYNAFTNPPNDPASFAASLSWQNASSAASAGLLQALAQANGFTLEDLQANREGWMSPRQRTEVIRQMRGCLFWILVFSFVIAETGGMGVVMFIGGPGALNGFAELVLVLVGLVLTALLAPIPISSARKQLREGRVTFVDGFVERERKESSDSEGGTTTSYHYVVYQQQPSEVKQQSFTVNGAAFYALAPGLRYRVYYLPGSHKLTSIEPLA